MSLKFTAGHFSSLAVFSTRSVFQAEKKRDLFQENVLFWALGGRKTHSELTGSTEWNLYFTIFGEFFSSLTNISFEQISSTQKPLPKRAFYQKTAWIRATTNFQDLPISSKMILLTITKQSWLRDGIFPGSRIRIPGIRDRDFLFWARSKNPENPEIPGIGIGI